MSRIAPKTVFACPTRWLLAAGALFVLAYGTDGSRATQDYLLVHVTRIKLTFPSDGTCRASGCYARAELSAADAVSFGIEIPVMGRTISTPLAWHGFPEEFTGAPATSAQDERQRWIRTYLPPALSDFIQ